ncbi:MAG: 3-keto-disaccharide hydrolase [Chitinophagaceae bacterium]
MKKSIALMFSGLIGLTMTAFAQQSPTYLTSPPPENSTMKPEQTEYYSPVPPVVTPGKSCGEPASDAIILFDGKNLDNWVSAQDTTVQAAWTVSKGIMTVNPGKGNIETKQKFEDYQLHLEWREPKEPHNQGQDRGNSGLFLASVGPGDDGYELQILDSYQAGTYVDGQCGSIYKQFPPLVNACRPPGDWQTYDVIWTAPRFNADGSVKSPAAVTAFQNGVLIQNHVILSGRTVYIGHPYYTDYGPAPIKLQDHHHRVSFRNIWIRPLP